METLTINRVLDGSRRGGSRPVIVDTPSGRHLVKLRGAAQGSGALVSEIIVAELAETLHLPVLTRRLAILELNTPIDDKDDELADLLAASTGLNLAFPMMDNARDAKATDLVKFTLAERAAILWLDRFVMNPDRTNRNPNILYCGKLLYLIDHGAALRFQYNWPNVTEETPREIGSIYKPHIFETISELNEWPYWEASFAQCITRSILEKALAALPNRFLHSMLPTAILDKSSELQEKAIQHRKAAYVAFLWKRLKPPRNFATQPPVCIAMKSSGKPPKWLTNKFSRRKKPRG